MLAEQRGLLTPPYYPHNKKDSALTLGVLGGMGPAASVAFLQCLINATPAARDQEHIPVIMSSIPQVPDRTQALLGIGPSPLPMLLDGIARLEAAGADIFVMPCNTAHVWFNEVKAATSLPGISMIDSTVDALLNNGRKRVGLLATQGTYQSQLYLNALAKVGITCICPSLNHQTKLMQGILAIKSNQYLSGIDLVTDALAELITNQADAIILGCTELSLISQALGKLTSIKLYDTTQVLAQACVNTCIPPFLLSLRSQ